MYATPSIPSARARDAGERPPGSRDAWPAKARVRAARRRLLRRTILLGFAAFYACAWAPGGPGAPPLSFATSLAIAIALIGAGTDLIRGRLSSSVSYLGLAFGLCLASYRTVFPPAAPSGVSLFPPGGWWSRLADTLTDTGILGSLGGVALMLAVALPAYATRGMGGGDVKLLAAIGALMGVTTAGIALAIAAVVALAFMAANRVSRGELLPRIQGLASWIAGCFGPRVSRVHAFKPGRVPFAPAVLVGIVSTIALSMVQHGSWRPRDAGDATCAVCEAMHRDKASGGPGFQILTLP